jgi:hypothetical protein
VSIALGPRARATHRLNSRSLARRLKVSDRTKPGLITTGIGWWRPDPAGPEFGVLDVNVNAALSYQGAMDPVSTSIDTGAIACRVRAA